MTTRHKLAWLLLLFVGVVSQAYAGVTLLLEEPYSYDGTFGGTGHAAVYLSRVCAESPVILRRCAPGELGAVISRYDGIAGRDWIAIPLIPYLYAVEKPENVPLSADPKLADFLRDQYRRTHLQAIAPDGPEGRAPGGRWAELLGADYRRTIYGFGLDTTEEQDAALIRKYNSDPNRTRFNLVTHNCADFARNLINFYFPKTLHRAVLGDLGVTTPKQIAKLFVRYGQKHPELHLSSFVIPQAPGNIRRSAPVHGVSESILTAKKYTVPLLVLHPVLTSCMVVAAVGGVRFNPARDVMVFDPSRELEPPMDAAQRRMYQDWLNTLKQPLAEDNLWNASAWQQLQTNAVPRLDSSGNPVLEVQLGDERVELGLSRSNILRSSAPPELAELIVVLRLREELRNGGFPRASEQDVANDWGLLQRVLLARRRKIAATDTRLTAMRSGPQ
ncbi:MAG TPA: hypothetical protein VNZ03_06135 [Terriglobales bacterium]|nr:hypothetical protein [Terriglobales bacterium]